MTREINFTETGRGKLNTCSLSGKLVIKNKKGTIYWRNKNVKKYTENNGTKIEIMFHFHYQ